MKAKLNAAWAAGAPSARREPTAAELATGFPCGPADQALFNELCYRQSMAEAELVDVITRAGLAPSEGDLTQASKAIRSQRLNLATPAGTANAITLTLAPAPASWAELDGTPLRLIPVADNTGAATLAPNGLTPRAIMTRGGPLLGGELRAGVPVEMLVAGSAVHIISGGANPYVEYDVTGGDYSLPSLASTALGYEITVRLKGTPAALPVPAVKVTGGGNIIWRGVARASVPTLGRGETLVFRRVADGYLMTVAGQSQRAFFTATDAATTWQPGAYAYGPIPYLTTVGGDATAMFGFDGKKFFAPVSGQYLIILRAQFNANGGAAGAGVAITAGAFTSIANAMAYSYTDFADTFSTNQTAEVTNYLDAGDRIDFNFTLTNGNSRVRAQDFGVSVVYLGR